MKKPRRKRPLADEKFVELCRAGSPDEIARALAVGANPNARRAFGQRRAFLSLAGR